MKTLIVHPEDQTTVFLNPIYARIPNQTCLQANSSKEEVLDMIQTHDRVLMMGHGSPYGLLAMDKFTNRNYKWPLYVIDEHAVSLLRAKKDSLFIWCHADQYVREFQLSGFFCGMFVSSVEEAITYELTGVTQNQVDESNDCFAEQVSLAVHLPIRELWQQVKEGYGQLAESGNPVAQYNHERLYYHCN
jgi:hypothetical protein